MLTEDLGPRVTSSIFALKNACREEWQNDIHNDQEQQSNNETVVRVVGGFPQAFENKD